MATHHEYRVVAHIPEDDEWDDQEVVSSRHHTTFESAVQEMNLPLKRGFPKGTERYIEVRSFTDWGRL